MSWVAVATTAVGVGSQLLKPKAQAPAAVPYQPVDVGQAQGQTTSANLSALPSIDDLLGQSNTFQQGQASSLMEKAIPGYGQLSQTLVGQATRQAQDPYAVPKSVTDQIASYAAENNINTGAGAASGFSGNNTLRSLGINALQYGQSNLSSALSALTTLTGTAPRVSPMSPLSFLLTPNQTIAAQTNNNTMSQNIGQGAANASTAASNYNDANLWDSITGSSGSIGSIVGKLAGTSGGGGGTTGNQLF